MDICAAGCSWKTAKRKIFTGLRREISAEDRNYKSFESHI